MHVYTHFGVLATVGFVVARSAQHLGNTIPELSPLHAPNYGSQNPPYPQINEKEAKVNVSTFAVNGSAIPDVNFDIGESYAGLLPISSDPNETRELFFWYFPSTNPLAEDKITIWLNGGPGCSSLEALLQGNGPFLWQYGTFLPVQNPWTWVNLTNMVWIEQPVGTGFSQGTRDATNGPDLSREFLGFFKNFVDTFSLHNRKIYITGESYAGFYIPYIADAMLNKEDTTYYGVDSIMIYDPSTSTAAVQRQIPAVAYVDYWAPLFSFNASFMEYLYEQADTCGYTAFMNEHLVFPAAGPLPSPPLTNPKTGQCNVWNDIFKAESLLNPCFDQYQIQTTCPVLFDVLGFPGSFKYVPEGATVYFNRTDVQEAINAPVQEWTECVPRADVFVDGINTSPPSGLSVLPSVIERLNKTIIGHGALDYILMANGTLLMIQNMTWNGAQGFTSKPSDDFFVPYHTQKAKPTLAGAGVFGTTHTERGLTWVEVSLSGHMVPQYAPSASFRLVEFMLGRIDNVTEMSCFTTDTGCTNGGGTNTYTLMHNEG